VVTTPTTTLVLRRCAVNELATLPADANVSSALCAQCSIDYLEERDSGTIGRLGGLAG